MFTWFQRRRPADLTPSQPVRDGEWFKVSVRGFDVDRRAISQSVFHGVNKSGSLASATVLRNAFVDAGRIDQFVSHYHRQDLSLADIHNLMRERDDGTCFAGHVLLNAAEPKPGRVYITQLRHPVARAISVYHWSMYNSRAVRSGKRAPNTTTTLRDFLKGAKVYSASAQIAFGTGPNFNRLTRSVASEDIRYLAMDALTANIFLYGIAEHFEESLFLYAHLLGLPMIPKWKRDLRNKGRPDIASIEQADIDALNETLEDEIIFYEWARDEFLKKLQSIDFGPELESYKKACATEYSNRIT